MVSEPINIDNYLIDENKTFNWELIESINALNSLYVSPIGFAEYSFSILNEDFENGLIPLNWDMQTNSSVGWYVTNDGNGPFWEVPSGEGMFACANDDASNDDGSNDYLITPYLDFSGISNIILNFSSYFSGQWGQTAFVKVSINDGPWNVVHEMGCSSRELAE